VTAAASSSAEPEKRLKVSIVYSCFFVILIWIMKGYRTVDINAPLRHHCG
jgi:hypothetical protein